LIRIDPAIADRLGGATIRGKIAGWPLATFNAHLPVVADRVALLGDAAGLINPLNGEGIQYALQSARWSIETLHETLSHDRVSAVGLSPYAQRVQRELRLDMAVSRLLVDLARNRSLNQLWLAALAVIGGRAARDGEYSACFGGILAGIVRAREALSISLAGRTVVQAAAMVRPAHLMNTARVGASMAGYASSHLGPTLDWVVQSVLSAFEVAQAGVLEPADALSGMRGQRFH
jgi:hypothetical protein